MAHPCPGFGLRAPQEWFHILAEPPISGRFVRPWLQDEGQSEMKPGRRCSKDARD
jgi:hypothetical protein